MEQDLTPTDASAETFRPDLLPLFAANLPDGVLVTRAEDERIAYANHGLERMSGYGAGELQGRSLRTLSAEPEEISSRLEAARSFLEEHPLGCWVAPVRLRRKDGSTFWVEARTSVASHPVSGEFWITYLIERPAPLDEEPLPTGDLGVVQQLIDALPNALLIVDAKGRMLRTNPATHALWPGGRALDREELPSVEVWDEQDAPLPVEATPLIRGLREGVTTRRKLLHHRAPSGELISTRTSVVPLVKRDGQQLGVAMLLDDVTRPERLHARIAEALEAAREAILVVSRKGNIRFANRSARALLGGEGLPREVSIDVFFDPPSREVLHAALGSLSRESDQGAGPLRLNAREAGGRSFSAEAHLVPNRGVAGVMDEVTMLLADVTASDARLAGHRLLARAGWLLLGSLDPNRTIAHVAQLLNDTWCDYFALDLFDDAGHLVRKTVGATKAQNDALAQVLRHPTDPDRVPEARRVLHEGQTISSSARTDETPWVMAGSGDPSRVARMLGVRSWMMTPLVLKGHVMGALTLLSCDREGFGGEKRAVLTSLAEIVAVAIDNARRHGEARAAIEAREQLLRIVAHDLRSPLQSVRLAAELTVRKLDAGITPDAAQVQAIGRAARRMDRLIADLLDWARIGGGKLAVEPAPVEVLPLMQEVAEAVRPSAGAHRLSLRVDPGLPRILGDRGRLIQVLVNLASNALKFTPAGGRVTLSASIHERSVRFSVEDDGPGMEPELRRRVFEPFYQREPGDHRGLGLGLTIASGLVRAHGSRLEVTSEPGKGSCFFFDLRIAQDT